MEAQNKNERNLPKRSRYHQAEMDVSSLKPGQDFNDLKPGYVIFICTFDPFGEKLYQYTFEERCLERDFPLGDETKKIFLSTKGENADEVPEELVHFLEYMENSTDAYVVTVTEKSINKLHNKITELKKERELEARYMTFEELLRSREKDGIAEGIIKGKAEDILELLEDYGSVPEQLAEEISSQQNVEVLKKWLKLAAKVTSIEEFTEKM